MPALLARKPDPGSAGGTPKRTTDRDFYRETAILLTGGPVRRRPVSLEEIRSRSFRGLPSTLSRSGFSLHLVPYPHIGKPSSGRGMLVRSPAKVARRAGEPHRGIAGFEIRSSPVSHARDLWAGARTGSGGSPAPGPHPPHGPGSIRSVRRLWRRAARVWAVPPRATYRGAGPLLPGPL